MNRLDAQQAKAQLGGLHATSVGQHYPWNIVGRGQEKLWEVHNLQDGTALYFRGAVWQGSLSEAMELLWRVIDPHFLMGCTDFSVRPQPLSEIERARAERLKAEETTGYALRAKEVARLEDAEQAADWPAWPRIVNSLLPPLDVLRD